MAANRQDGGKCDNVRKCVAVHACTREILLAQARITLWLCECQKSSYYEDTEVKYTPVLADWGRWLGWLTKMKMWLVLSADSTSVYLVFLWPCKACYWHQWASNASHNNSPWFVCIFYTLLGAERSFIKTSKSAFEHDKCDLWSCWINMTPD